MPSQFTELLDAEPQKLPTKERQEETKTGSTMKGKRYQRMPKVDVRTIQEEKINPGTMREILVHANMGHDGISLISPVRDLDKRCMYPQATSLMTTRLLKKKVDSSIMEKQQQRNKNGRRCATYAVYNTSHEVITLPKNQIVGRCQLILQPNKGAYLQEMAAI